MLFKHLLSICFIILAPAVFSHSPDETFDLLKNLYETYGESDYIGEDVSQIQHALLTAAVAKQECPQDQELIIAALLHDIGHLLTLKDVGSLPSYGAKNHEIIGGDHLKSLGFSDRIVYSIQGHVNAKRYLCYKNQNYLKKLSHGSYESLKTQGWIMNDDEAKVFERSPYFRDILALRSFEERGKDPKGFTEPFDAYKDIIRKHLSS